MTEHHELEDPRFLGGIQLLERTGARSFQIRYQDDEKPTVWLAIAQYGVDPKTRIPLPKGGIITYNVAASLSPLGAVMRLCDESVTGGVCTHCNRPAGFDENFGQMPLEEHICWYQWDPETKKFRRGCQGG